MKTKLTFFFIKKWGGVQPDIPSTPGVTTTPPHPKYQCNNINNTQNENVEKLSY